MKSSEVFDVIVIGGGPSGMTAAGRAAELGSKVLLLEKNTSLGKKLLITGGGRCNVTNAEFDTPTLLSKFKESNKFLFSAFSQRGVTDTLEFFHSRGMETKVENEKRVFPVSDSAESVWNVLVEYLKKGGVTIRSNSEVERILSKENKVTGVRLRNGNEILGRNIILATGGKSRPETGSTGDGFNWLRNLGHTVSEPSVALVPLKVKDTWVKRLQGITLTDIKIIAFQNNTKQLSKRGKILFTHFGVSGPTVLNMSKDIGELLKYGEVILSLDFLPSLDYGKLNEKLQEIFKDGSNKKIKNVLNTLILSGLIEEVLDQAGISSDTFCHSVTREERIRLIEVLKGLRMEVTGLLGVDKAIITSGGVDLKEVDFRTMRSRLFPNLFFVGDILNIDRPTGGYGLQLCWTTGFVAGTHANSQKETE